MDKYEYKLKTEQMLELMEDGAFNKAAEIADSIDWKRVRNTKMLTDVSDIYEKNGDYQKSYEVLNIAYHRAEGSRKIVYRLCTLALKTKNVDEAIDYYDDFQQIAPKDPNKFILRYQILRAQRAPIEQQIEALEAFKKAEYIEEWAYELAKRYQEAGMTAECLEECDDLILWFNEGKYVYQAMELKMQYKPLTPSQQEKYDNRYSRMSNETMEMPNIVEYKNEKEAAAKEESVDEMLAEAEEIQTDNSDTAVPDTKKREAKGRKIGSTMKLDEALKSLLNLGMGEEDKVRDSSSEPVSTDVVFEEDMFQGAIEEIESIADLKLVDEISNQKGLRELKVDPDLEELLPDEFPDERLEDGSDGIHHIEPVTTIMQPIRIREAGELRADPGPESPELTEKKTLEELYAEADASLESQIQDSSESGSAISVDGKALESGQSGDTRILDKETVRTLAELDSMGERSAEKIRQDEETLPDDNIENVEIIAELNEDAREIIAELDEEARRTIEELDAEEEQPAEQYIREAVKTSEAEQKNQVEGQMNLLDLMTELDDESEYFGDQEIVSDASGSFTEVNIIEAEEAELPAKEDETEADGIKVKKKKIEEPILPLDIQRMIDEIEGVVPVEEASKKAAKEEQQKQAAAVYDEEPAENMGDVADQLRVDESSEWFEDYDDVLDEEEYADDRPEENEALDGEEYTEDIEISFGRDDEETADEYDEAAEYDDFGGSAEADEHFAIEYQEAGELIYEEGELDEEAGNEYSRQYQNIEPEFENEGYQEAEYTGGYEDAEYADGDGAYGEEEYAGEYEDIDSDYENNGYEEAEPEYTGEYEGDETDYEDAGYEEGGPEYSEEYEDINPDYENNGYEETEAEYAEEYEGEGADYEDTGYGEAEPEYTEEYEGEESDYENAGYGEAEPEYTEEYEGEESDYENDGYEEDESEYREEYEDVESDYEEGESEYSGEYEDANPGYENDEYEEAESEYPEEYGDEPDFEGGYDEEYDQESEYEDDYEEDAEYDDEDNYDYEYEDDYAGEYEEEEDNYDAASVEANLEDEFRPQRASRHRYDEREVPDEEEEMNILSATTPLSRKETAKLIATGKTSPLPVDEISDALSMSDTGFVVHGRYDLRTQSGIGTRAGLTEEQKKLFSYFVPVRGMSEQLVDVLEQDKNCTNRRGTSNTGNLLIIGNKGNGKTVLAVDVVKAIQKQRNIRQGRVAIVTGDSLNKKKISDIFSKLYGGALIIEKAGKMNEKTVARVNKAMERDTGELLIVLEDQRKPLDRLLTSNREFRRKFTSRLEVPILINDELVTFGQTYAQENGYQIDEMGILALYSRIDMLQREDHAVTIAEVKEVMDEAMEHSQKASAKKLVKRVLGKNRDDSDRIILTEKDFI